VHHEKLYYDLFRNLSRTVGQEIALKARVSKGMSVDGYFGSFGLRETPDITLSAMDADKSLGFSLRNNSELDEKKLVFIQVAMLYSNQTGERRLRIFN
jgi:protein transport protein SEC24